MQWIEQRIQCPYLYIRRFWIREIPRSLKNQHDRRFLQYHFHYFYYPKIHRKSGGGTNCKAVFRSWIENLAILPLRIFVKLSFLFWCKCFCKQEGGVFLETILCND